MQVKIIWRKAVPTVVNTPRLDIVDVVDSRRGVKRQLIIEQLEEYATRRPNISTCVMSLV